jgi:hypothetical protein
MAAASAASVKPPAAGEASSSFCRLPAANDAALQEANAASAPKLLHLGS